MFWVGGVALAISQIGFERSRGTLDFTLGLPYKRGVISILNISSAFQFF
ncbi:hypothetical protein PO124_18365 [Bacillus licheniformis]|nr:hypothetical protein [Bacillus licheniformis]